MRQTQITEKTVRRILEVVDQGLTNELGIAIPGQMCVLAAVCFALGERHTDAPSCVDGSVRWLNFGLNEARWSSNATRAQ